MAPAGLAQVQAAAAAERAISIYLVPFSFGIMIKILFQSIKSEIFALNCGISFGRHLNLIFKRGVEFFFANAGLGCHGAYKILGEWLFGAIHSDFKEASGIFSNPLLM